MDLRDRRSALVPGTSSYFTAPEATLDPALFVGTRMRAEIRLAILSLVYRYWDAHYTGATTWSTVWLAGSGVSYQWSAARNPGDLDCLIGVDYVGFRESNPAYAGLSNAEISSYLNQGFRADLMPSTTNWHGYELTFYVNNNATDIRNINPYAAYDLTSNTWTVEPTAGQQGKDTPEFAARAQQDAQRANDVLAQLGVDHQAAVKAGAALFDEIHEGRHAAFAPGGKGYDDWANYRWQAGKRSGTVPAMNALKTEATALRQATELQLYGGPLEGVGDLVLKAALWRSAR